MAEDPRPTPHPYLDPYNQALLKHAASVTGNDTSAPSLKILRRDFHKLAEPAPRNPGITITHFPVPTSHGDVKVFLYRPKMPGSEAQHFPLIVHLHGGGWIALEAFAYERFVFQLVELTGCAVALPEYTLAPKRKFPVQQEQCLDVLQWLVEYGGRKGLDTSKVVVSGDSAGGQLAPAVSILNHQRSLHLPIAHQILLHPVVDATTLTATFSQFLFQDGPFESSADFVIYFNAYFAHKKDRSTITASPILMTNQQAKEYMPPTTIISSQVDWLRDQDQNFAKLLQQAGVPCAVLQDVACIHDVEILAIARQSPTAQLVMLALAARIRAVFWGEEAVFASPTGRGWCN